MVSPFGSTRDFRNFFNCSKQKFEQSHSAEKRGKVSVSKKWKVGPFCFGMASYLMLEALDALKRKYLVHVVKVHNAQKVD